eukprot:gnl/TRDRNA2_/TRDRNA2_76764_c0_seq1.p2 gnl/TRDRNA2_/TRDRNA2_76764_c0~~gnl/TRDRNA2_/TRDRNA2_76764_c0_seq1.p2  ORF type:complete len:105 (+),score=31.41 gnl/TRDRNA2_/TRDRNA2_76764_c0_seq1:163-477(+)
MVCGGGDISMERDSASTLQDLLDALKEHKGLQLTRPSITGARGVVFIQNPAPLRKQHEYKLEQTLEELTKAEPPVFDESEELIVTDPALPARLKLRVTLKRPEA